MFKQNMPSVKVNVRTDPIGIYAKRRFLFRKDAEPRYHSGAAQRTQSFHQLELRLELWGESLHWF